MIVGCLQLRWFVLMLLAMWQFHADLMTTLTHPYLCRYIRVFIDSLNWYQVGFQLTRHSNHPVKFLSNLIKQKWKKRSIKKRKLNDTEAAVKLQYILKILPISIGEGSCIIVPKSVKSLGHVKTGINGFYDTTSRSWVKMRQRPFYAYKRWTLKR